MYGSGPLTRHSMVSVGRGSGSRATNVGEGGVVRTALECVVCGFACSALEGKSVWQDWPPNRMRLATLICVDILFFIIFRHTKAEF